MSTLQDVLQLQLILFLLMLAGLVLTRRGVITPAGRKCLTDLLIDLILPCNIICSFRIELDGDILRATALVLGIAFGIQLACWALGKLLYRFAAEPRRKVLQYATMCSNAGFMGNPIIEGIYGAQGLLYASVYLIPLRFFMWSAGLSCFTHTTAKETFKKLALHPCILAVWIGFALMLTKAPLPGAVERTLSYLSGCTLPVSIVIIGSILAGVRPGRVFHPLTLYFCAVRLIGIPLLTLLVCRLAQVDALVTGVCVVLAGMPAGSTTAILAEKYGGDAEYASACVLVSTLLSLLTIPLLCWLMTAL